MKTELITVIGNSELEENKLKNLLDKFSTFFDQANDFESRAREIVVTDESQKDMMSEARTMRLDLKDIRVKTEKTRKELKEQSLREGKAIDGIANIIKAVVVPIEEHLERQEKFIENIENMTKDKVHQERIDKLSEYVEDVVVYNLREMSDEGFDQLLETSRAAIQAQRDAEKKAEDDRVAKDRANAEEKERMRLENERLKNEAEMAEVERKKVEDEKIKAENELKASKELERKKTEEKEREEKEARLAPDKEKLLAFADKIKSVECPTNLSMKAQSIVDHAEKALLEIAQIIKNKIKDL